MNDRPAASAPRPHKPVPFAPADFEPFAGGTDPARVSEAAHLAARALVNSGRASNDPEVTKRLQAQFMDPAATPPVQFRAYMDDELKRWEPLIKKLGIKGQ